MDIKIIDTQNGLKEVVRQLKNETIIGLDTETRLFGNPPALCLIQIAVQDACFLIDPLAIEDISPLKEIFEDHKIVKAIHFANFERCVLRPFGIELHNVYDTCTHSRKLRGRQVSGGHNLKDVSFRELGIVMDKSYQRADWTVRPLTQGMIQYAALDAIVLVKLYKIFKSISKPNSEKDFMEPPF
ncbi:MAG: ribonuclease D [Candidatus Goldbacteria bacterium]|nr:ribonuclease D [Candidatus Goldiibacteriota bacterium]